MNKIISSKAKLVGWCGNKHIKYGRILNILKLGVIMTKSVGKIIKLFISKADQKQRVSLNEIEVDENGVVGDKFYAKDVVRSILLTSQDSYNLAKEHGIDLEHSLLGENILMDFNPYNLEQGTKIKMGEVILEISQNCTICNHLSAVDTKLPKLLKNHRGIFARVLKGGIIKVNNDIII